MKSEGKERLVRTEVRAVSVLKDLLEFVVANFGRKSAFPGKLVQPNRVSHGVMPRQSAFFFLYAECCLHPRCKRMPFERGDISSGTRRLNCRLERGRVRWRQNIRHPLERLVDH